MSRIIQLDKVFEKTIADESSKDQRSGSSFSLSVKRRGDDSFISATPTPNKLNTIGQNLTSVCQVLTQLKQNVTDLISKYNKFI